MHCNFIVLSVDKFLIPEAKPTGHSDTKGVRVWTQGVARPKSLAAFMSPTVCVPQETTGQMTLSF
jgi:hypothetical protein